MRVLTRAHDELFRRSPDETFPSLDVLSQHCRWQRDQAHESWQSPQALEPTADEYGLTLSGSDGQRFSLNDWSFGQLCRREP